MSEQNQIEALAAAGDVAGLQALAGSTDKAVAKAAKKALHVLRTRGVKIAGPAPVKVTPRAIGDQPDAWTCPPDANGERLVIAVLPAPGGDFHAITAHVSDERGLIQLALGKGPRKHARDVRDSFERAGSLTGDVPVERAAAIIERAYQVTLAQGGSPPPDFATARRLLPRVQARADAPHPVLEAIAPGELSRDAAEALHDLPTIRRWVPGPDQLQALEQRLEEVAVSRLLVDEAQRRQAWAGVIDRTIAECFDAAGRARWQRRLYDAAEAFAAANLADDAAVLRAQGDRLAAPDFDPLTDPFCRRFVEKITEGLVLPPPPDAEDQGGAGPGGPPAGGLIVAP